MDSSAPRRSSRASARVSSISNHEGSSQPDVSSPSGASHGTSEPSSPPSSSAGTPVTSTQNKRKTSDTDFDGPRLSKKKGEYYDKGVQAYKPEPFGIPPVHSEIRQSLCEAVPYFRAYQSGAYTNDKRVIGFLCDKEASIRAKFTPEVMIATTGGGKFQDENGKMIQGKDNMGNNASRSFMNTMDAKSPVAVIAGQGNPISPSKLPAYYCVLDWFHVTDVWCEMSAENTQDGAAFMRWMCRLEKIDLNTTSWWAPKGSPSPPPAPDFNTKAPAYNCLTCGVGSKEIYDAGWACLNPKCEDFFKFSMEIDHQTLNINPAFINERTQYTGVAPGPLIPDVPTLGSSVLEQVGQATSDFNKAMVCPQCHGCIQKKFWNGWICGTSGCGYKHTLENPLISAADALLDNTQSAKSIVDKGINQISAAFGAFETDIYELLDPQEKICGYVAHLKSTDAINKKPGGPDDLFKMMQSAELNLKRGVIKGKDGGVTQMLTAHYAANWGAPYKWHVAHDSVSFANTPEPILRALNRLTWAGKQTCDHYNSNHIGAEFLEPNEVLSVGYKTDGKMSWHDDGEKGVGPTVASLSLGCTATMAWRPNTKYFGDMRIRKRGAIKSFVKSRLGNQASLKIVLNHGDIMIMHGALMQRYYEHEVVPLGKLRFAITARRVKPSSLSPEVQVEAELAGTVPPHRQLPPYNGDIDLLDHDESADLDQHAQELASRNQFVGEVLDRVAAGEMEHGLALRAAQDLVNALQNNLS